MLSRSALALAVAAVLAACGGGDSPTISAQDFAGRAASTAPAEKAMSFSPQAPTLPAASAVVATITNDQLFSWAQKTFPQYFGSTAPQRFTIAFQGKTFDVAGYTSGNYIGVAEGTAYVLGPLTGNALTSFGAVSNYVDLVCASLGCGTTNPPPTGSLNECIDPASSNLPTGFRMHLVYAYTGVLSGDQTVDSVVDGPATFEGQSAIQVTSTTTGSNSVDAGGFTTTTTTTTTTKSYEQKGSNGLLKTLGHLVDATSTTTLPSIPGLPPLPGTSTTTSTKTVYNPPTENIEFTLTQGNFIDKTTTQTTTTLASSFPTPPLTTTSTQRFTFEAKETVTVPAGTFNTCRYKFSTPAGTDVSTGWLIVGKGVMVKSESTAGGRTQSIVLKSGTYNGGSL